MRESDLAPKLTKMSVVRSSRKVLVDNRDAERLGDLFHNRLPTEDQLESLLRLLSNYDRSATPRLVNSPVMKYANQTSVHLAAKGGSYHCLEILLKHGGDPNMQSSHADLCQTPLHLAAAKGFAQCIQMLIEYGACTDIKDFNNLRAVDLARGKKRCEKAFEDAKAQNLVPLMIRSEKEQRIVQELHECVRLDAEKFVQLYQQLNSEYYDLSIRWLDFCQRTLLYRATEAESVKSIELILELSPGRQPLANIHSGDTPLLAACRKKNHEIATLLLAHSPKLLLIQNKQYRYSALHLSALSGDSKMVHLLVGYVRHLLEQKELTHESHFSLDLFDVKEVTPLFIACKNDHKEVVEILLDLQNEFSDVILINVNRVIGEDKRTPLHIAVEKCNLDIVRVLLTSKDIDVNVQAKPSKHTHQHLMDTYVANSMSSGSMLTASSTQAEVKHGKAGKSFHEIYITPLVEACVYGSKAIVELLLQHGAVDKDGLACSVCRFLSHFDLEQIILSYHCAYGVVSRTQLKKKKAVTDTSLGLKLKWNSMNLEACNRAWLSERITYITTPYSTESSDRATAGAGTSKFATHDYSAVKVVNLCQNNLIEVPLELFSLPNVVEINISHNKIAILPVNQYTCLNAALCGWDCKYLELLNLSHNQLNELPSCIWMLPNLREIHCCVNRLLILPDPLSQQDQISDSLNHIDFSRNRLKSVPEMIWLLNSLKELNLSDNHLSVSGLNFPSLIKPPHLESDQDSSVSPALMKYQAITQSKSVSSGYESIEELTFGYRRNIEFFECHYSLLRKLNIANNELTEFPEALPCIAPNLQELDISNNTFDSIDIQLIPQLITKFVARNCRIRHFGNVLEKKRHAFIVTNCRSVFENPSLCQHRSHQQLPFLNELDLSGNCLTQIQLLHRPPLSRPNDSEDPVIHDKAFLANASSTALLYPNLEVLNLEQNDLTGLLNPNIGHHSQLRSLLLSDNKSLEVLPNELGMLNLAVMSIQDTPSLIDPPQKYQQVESRDNLSHLLHFLKARLRKSVKYRSIKLFFIGKEGRGKTTLQHRLRSVPIKEIKRSTTSTVGVDINQWCYPDAKKESERSVDFLTWDFAGQDVYHTTHQCFYSRRSLYLALFRLTDGYQGIKELEPWLKNVKLRAPGCPVIIVGTHRDKVSRRDIMELEKQALQEYSNDFIYPEVVKVTSISSTQSELFGDMKNLRALIYDVACHLQLVSTGRYLKYNPDMKEGDPRALLNQQIPHSFADLQDAIRQELVTLKVNNQPPIMEEKEFRSTFLKHFNGIAEMEEAVRFLTLQGTLLHFEDHQLKMHYFLDPQWMAKLMAKVIQPNSPVKDGISQVDTLLAQCGVPEILQPIYISLLEKFEVAMVTNQQHIIIPSLMPAEAELPNHDKQALILSTIDDCYQPSLRRFWHSDYIPDGFWPRLICRIVKDFHISRVMHTIIGDDPDKSEFHNGMGFDKWKMWKTGICFIHRKQILFILKQKSNVDVNPGSIQVNVIEEKLRIELHLHVNEFITLARDEEHQLSRSYVIGLATHLLVMISQHIELLVNSWFPHMLKTQLNGSIITHIPCWKCFAGIDFDKISAAWLHIPGCFTFTSRNPVFCFVLEDNIIMSALGKELHCPIHNELELLHMMPDLLFMDVNAVFEDSHCTFLDDSNRMLGKGGFGFVFEGELRSKHDTLGKKVAVKVFMHEMEKYMEPGWNINQLLQLSQEPENISYAYKEIRKEVYFLSSLSNPYITGFCGVKTHPYMGILLELAPKKSLRFILKEYDACGIVLEPVTLKNTALQMAKGLKYLHAQQVVHLDIKSANILVWFFPSAHDDRPIRVRQAGNVWIKITDYGISQQVSTGSILKVGRFPSIGTPGFIAPELLENPGICMEISSEKIDVFAYGMTLYEILSLRSPFYHEPLIKRNSLVCERQRPLLHGRETRFPILYQDLMSLCWKHEPHERPNMSQVQELIDAPEFERLRTEIDLKDNATVSCTCVCRVDNFSDEEEAQGHKPCTQIWVCGYTNGHAIDQTDLKPKVEVFMYKDGQTEQYNFDMSFIGEVASICPVRNNRIWLGLKSSVIVVLDTVTLKIVCSGTLDESVKEPISNIIHIDFEDTEESSIVLVTYQGMMWSLCNEIYQNKFQILDQLPLPESCQTVKVKKDQDVEVWGAMENNLFILERECTGWRKQELNVDFKDPSLGLSSCIVHTHFTGVSGSDQSHVWISYCRQTMLVSFDVISRKQRCILDCAQYINEGSEVSTLLAVEKKVFVGTSGGTVAVFNSESNTFLTTYSWHEGKIDALLLLPKETKPSICSEIPFESPDSPSSSSQTHAVPVIDNIHNIPNPEPNSTMVISIGEGQAKYSVNSTTLRSRNEVSTSSVSNSHLMIWKT